jgi:hypothetical protein
LRPLKNNLPPRGFLLEKPCGGRLYLLKKTHDKWREKVKDYEKLKYLEEKYKRIEVLCKSLQKLNKSRFISFLKKHWKVFTFILLSAICFCKGLIPLNLKTFVIFLSCVTGVIPLKKLIKWITSII